MSRPIAMPPASACSAMLNAAGDAAVAAAGAARIRTQRLAYAALVAAPLIDLAVSAGWSVLPGVPLSTIAA